MESFLLLWAEAIWGADTAGSDSTEVDVLCKPADEAQDTSDTTGILHPDSKQAKPTDKRPIFLF